MQAPVRWGLILGSSVAAMSLIFGLIGWHQVMTMSLVYLAIAILLNVFTVIMCLRESAALSTWGDQVKNGLFLGVVASVVIFLGSWLVTSTIFPEYFAEMAEGYRSSYEAMGLSGETLDEMVSATAATSPIKSALDGVIGTMATSLVVAGIAGLFLRKKD